jgi:hypothetical protein
MVVCAKFKAVVFKLFSLRAGQSVRYYFYFRFVQQKEKYCIKYLVLQNICLAVIFRLTRVVI